MKPLLDTNRFNSQIEPAGVPTAYYVLEDVRVRPSTWVVQHRKLSGVDDLYFARDAILQPALAGYNITTFFSGKRHLFPGIQPCFFGALIMPIMCQYVPSELQKHVPGSLHT